MDEKAKIGVGSLARGLVELVPDLPQLFNGLWNLLATKPENPSSIGAVFEQRVDRHPTRTFLRYGTKAWTYAQADLEINRFVAYFKTQSLPAGASIGLLGGNDPQILWMALACAKLGMIASMFNVNWKADAILHGLSITNCHLLMVVGSDATAVVDAIVPNLQKSLQRVFVPPIDPASHEVSPNISGTPSGYDNWSTIQSGLQPCRDAITKTLLAKQPAFYIFTSGTSGMPKASVMTHYRWLRCMAGMGQITMRLRAGDILYVCLPLYHNNALTVSLSAVVGAGACMALGQKFSISQFWKDIHYFKATSFAYIGELCRYLLNQSPSSLEHNHALRVIVGNGLRPDIWLAFKRRFQIRHIAEFYGASEGNLLFLNVFNQDCTAGFCPLSHKIVQYDTDRDELVRDAKGHLVPVTATGAVGLLINEVTKRSPFDGYTDAESTNKKLIKNGFSSGDCWFNTGDLVKRLPFGHIQFADRVGDTFRWKGENVATTEVESILQQYPAIEHAVVYGVEVPGTDGRAGMATVTLFAGRSIQWDDFKVFLDEKLPKYAQPLFVRLASQIAVTSTFKSQKSELKAAGFAPERCDPDEIWAWVPNAKAFCLLDAALYQQITAGNMHY